MGGIGWLGSHLITIYSIQQTLEVIAAGFMLALGLYIAGWWKGLASIERLGGKLVWKRLEPFGRRFMPVTTYRQAFFLGLIWGWLPCGLVYSVIIWTISTQSPLEGGLLMLSFGRNITQFITNGCICFNTQSIYSATVGKTGCRYNDYGFCSRDVLSGLRLRYRSHFVGRLSSRR